jgi:hypothetical protein
LSDPSHAATVPMLVERLAKMATKDRGASLQALPGMLRRPPLDQLLPEQRVALAQSLAPHLEGRPAFHAWFLTKFIESVIQLDDTSAGLELLRACEQRWPSDHAWPSDQERQWARYREVWFVDCLMAEGHIASAKDRIERTPAPVDEVDRLKRLRQQAEIDIALGRLELAARAIASAQTILEELSPADQDRATETRAELMYAQADLLLAADDEAGIQAHLEQLRRLPPSRIRPAEQAARLRAIEALALSLVGEIHPERSAEVAPAIRTALTLQGKSRLARQLMVHAAIDALQRGQLDEAEQALQPLANIRAKDRQGWVTRALTARLHRLQRRDRPTLLTHEQTLRSDLDAMIGEWKSVPLSEDGTGFLRLGRRMITIHELLELSLELHGPEAALAHVLAVHECTSLSRVRSIPDCTVSQLCKELFPPGHGALVYLPAWQQSLAFAIDSTGIRVERLPRASELRRLTDIVRQELDALTVAPADTEQLEVVRAASRASAQTLLQGSLGRALREWHHVTFCGSMLLGGLPSEALELDTGELLGERYAVATTESLPLLLTLQRGAAEPRDPGLVATRCFATLTPGAEFLASCTVQPGGSLDPGWAQLIAGVPGTPFECVGDRATARSFRESSARHWDLTLLLAHGRPRSAAHPAALGLSPTGDAEPADLTADAIRATRQHGLVMLAACYANRGPMRLGDDSVTATLAGAFLQAGAQAVAASDAPLRLGLHLAMARAMLAEIASGASAAEAARRARREVAAGDRAAAYLAAQIGIHGLGGGAIARQGRPTWPLFAVALAGAALIGCSWGPVRRRLSTSSAQAPPRRAEPGPPLDG